MSFSASDPIFMHAFMGDFGGYMSFKDDMDSGDFLLLTKEPEDWKNLQIVVFNIFKQLGYLASIEKKIESARSTIEIDVFAEKNIGKFNYEKVMIECKFWKNNVPQEVIHSVRTVADDIGANQAYIISKNGFQSGAIRAATYTLVSLYSFKEFVSIIADEWMTQFKNDYYNELRKLKKYDFLTEMLCWEVGTDRGFKTEERRDAYADIANRYYFLFYHWRILEQDIRINLEKFPEQYEHCVSNFATFLRIMPDEIDINGTICETKCMMGLYEIIFDHRVIDMLFKELSEFLEA